MEMYMSWLWRLYSLEAHGKNRVAIFLLSSRRSVVLVLRLISMRREILKNIQLIASMHRRAMLPSDLLTSIENRYKFV